MKQIVLRETLHVDENHQLHISVPADLGTEFEVIVLSVLPQGEVEDEARFMLAAYSAVTPENPEEDAIWEKYIHA